VSIAPRKGADQPSIDWLKSDQPGANERLIERVARGKGDVEDGAIFRKRLQTNPHFRNDVVRVMLQLESRIFQGGRDQGETTAACMHLKAALEDVSKSLANAEEKKRLADLAARLESKLSVK
jgi:hypothetical protein